MTSPIEMQRKVKQLDNDVKSIYEMLTSIEVTQKRHLNRLDGIEARADGIDVKVDAVQVKVDGIEAAQNRHGERLDAIESKVESLDTKVTGLDAKMDSVLDILRNRGSAAR